MTNLVTGCAGFIGFHTCISLLDRGKDVVGIDNLNNYYSTKLKKKRLAILKKYKKFKFFKIDLTNINSLRAIFKKKR